MTLELLNNQIKLTVCVEGQRISRELSNLETITIMGYKGVLYNDETSLFCSAYDVFVLMDDDELLDFIEYEDVDWLNMWDFVSELYKDQPVLVSCRKN